MSQTHLRSALLELIQSRTPGQAQGIIENHPELLSDAADALFTQLMFPQSRTDDQILGQRLAFWRELLRLCRRMGIKEGTEHALKIVEDYAPKLSPDLENLLQGLSQAKRAGDWSCCIGMCQQALTLVSRAEDASLWATLQRELGVSFAQNPLGNRGGNLERALYHLRQASEVHTREVYPTDWAMIQTNLASVYRTRILGERAENLEEALRLHGQALEVYSRQTHPTDWARVQLNLANVYAERIRGERTENVKEAIQLYNQTLEVYTQDAHPTVWAMILCNLAGLHGLTERAENLEEALRLCGESLKIYTRQAYPSEWGSVQHTLAETFRYRIRGERAENLEEALRLYNQALEVRTRYDAPTDWAATQNGLASLYAGRIRGERAENLERAIHHHRLALEVYTRNDIPERWAHTQVDLAIAYVERIRGDRAENLEEALRLNRGALEIYSLRGSPAEWARIHHNLGNLFGHRIRGERAENLEQSLRHFHQALKVRTRKDFPEHWAMTKTAIGYVYRLRVLGDRTENLARAIYHLEQSLEVYTQQDFPEYWAGAQINLANIYADQAGNFNLAIKHYQQALEIFTRERYPARYLLTQRNLGSGYFGAGFWEDAHPAFLAAIGAGNDLVEAAYTEVGRRAEVGETSLLYAHDGYCLLRLGQPTEALLRLEQGKIRLLAEALALGEIDLAMLPEAQRERLQAERQRVRDLEAEMRLPPDTDTPARRSDRELAEALRQARAELNHRIESIRAKQPDFMPTGLMLPEILGLIPEGGALVAPLFTAKGSAVFVVPHGAETVTEEHIVELNRFTDADLHAVLRGPDNEPELGGWLGAYANHRISPQIPIFKKQWWKAIESTGRALWDSLLGPVHERLQRHGLQQGAPVLIMPQAGLGLLPLHAAWRIVEGKKRYFLDDWTVTYVPSGYALSVSRNRLQEANRQEHALLAVINPTKDLPYTPAEGQAVTALFPDARSLPEDAATIEAVTDAVRGRQYLHFSCHGFYSWQNPMQSGLLLAEGKPLTLSEIIAKLDLGASRLITLSACETGITDITQSPDEYLGLPAGFLQAGAPAVVSTLWPVNDLSTMLLMERFYQNLLSASDANVSAPMPPAAALREAQIWLRDVSAGELAKRSDAIGETCAELPRGQTRFDQPYHWAAFTFSGA